MTFAALVLARCYVSRFRRPLRKHTAMTRSNLRSPSTATLSGIGLPTLEISRSRCFSVSAGRAVRIDGSLRLPIPACGVSTVRDSDAHRYHSSEFSDSVARDSRSRWSATANAANDAAPWGARTRATTRCPPSVCFC